MEERSDFSIAPLSDTDSALVDEAGERIAHVPGIVLEKVFRLDSGRLLVVTTEDCPFEEGFHVSLIDVDGSLLETAHRVIPYNPGIITEIKTDSEKTIRLVLHDGETIRISLVPNGTRNPGRYIQERFRSSNGLLGKHYFKIESTSGSPNQ